MTTFNRGKLLRLAKAGRLVIASSYHFDDMYGESRSTAPVPVAVKWWGRVLSPGVITPPDAREYAGKDQQAGVAYMTESTFKSHGRAHLNPNGTVTLYVHSNCNYTFTILDEKAAGYVSADTLPKGYTPGAEKAFSDQHLASELSKAHPGAYRDALKAERVARLVKEAGARGAAAFAEGLQSAPAVDPGFVPLLTEACKLGVTLEALEAFTRAWHAANLAQPVPGVSTLAHP